MPPTRRNATTTTTTTAAGFDDENNTTQLDGSTMPMASAEGNRWTMKPGRYELLRFHSSMSQRLPLSSLWVLMLLLLLLSSSGPWQGVAGSASRVAFVASTKRHDSVNRHPSLSEPQPTKTTAPTTSSVPTVSSPVSLPVWKLALAGGLATLVGDTVMHPVDCIKTLQQSDEGLYLSFVEASRLLWTESGGISGFYKGLDVYAASDVTGGCVKFAA